MFVLSNVSNGSLKGTSGMPALRAAPLDVYAFTSILP